MTDTTTTAFTVRFARLPRRGLLLGLSASRVACVGALLDGLGWPRRLVVPQPPRPRPSQSPGPSSVALLLPGPR